jgi:hypothetical protein
MMHSAATGRTFLVLFLFLLAPPATASVINVDVERAGDATHSGSDGVLSGTGTVWNSVLTGTAAGDLVDDSGASTGVGLVFQSTFFESPVPFGDGASTNDLQDSGVLGPGIDLVNLDPGETYSLAVYGNVGSVVHGGGPAGGCSRSGPTYLLPGTEGADYCLFTDLTPFEIQPGVYGIQLSGGIMVAGLQLLGGSSTPEPPADTTPPDCSMMTAEGAGTGSTLQVTIHDGESGIAAINVLVADNVTVSVASFAPGTTDPVVVTASSDDETVMGILELESEDTAGNAGVCNFQIEGSDTTPPADDCEAMVAFFQTAVEEGRITGLGSGNSARGRLGAFRNMLVESCRLWEDGQVREACDMLTSAARKCDGADNPPDFITGEAVPELMGLMESSPVGTACWSSLQSMLQSASVPNPAIPMSWGLIKMLYDE